MRAENDVRYVRSMRHVTPYRLDTSRYWYRALARYAYNDTRPNLDEIRYDLAEL